MRNLDWNNNNNNNKEFEKKKDVQEIWRIGRKITGVEMKERIDEE